MKKGTQEIYRRLVLALADAANMLWSFEKRYYINTLKQLISTAKTYEHNGLDETSMIDRHRYHMSKLEGLMMDLSKPSTIYRLPKLHKRPYKLRFIANASSFTTTGLSILLTSCLTVIKTMSLNNAQKFMKEILVINILILKIQVEFLIN